MRSTAIIILKFYKKFISPLLPGACRFEPTCSEYALEAIEIHGILRGSILSVRRILRCNPYCSCGYDPVPPPDTLSYTGLFSRNLRRN